VNIEKLDSSTTQVARASREKKKDSYGAKIQHKGSFKILKSMHHFNSHLTPTFFKIK
jgi:hypothetical protein